jgi:hypothetical protein
VTPIVPLTMCIQHLAGYRFLKTDLLVDIMLGKEIAPYYLVLATVSMEGHPTLTGWSFLCAECKGRIQTETVDLDGIKSTMTVVESHLIPVPVVDGYELEEA